MLWALPFLILGMLALFLTILSIYALVEFRSRFNKLHSTSSATALFTPSLLPLT